MTQDTIQSVLIDHREPPHVQRLAFDGATVAVTQLTCGDIWVAAADGNLLVIERKTANDLLASIADGRLFDQAAAMVDMSPWAYIAVEGTLTPTRDGKTLADGAPVNWRWASVQGALQTVQELGVAVVYLSGSDELAPYIERLARRDRGPVRAGAVRKPELLAPGMALLLALPGIGPDRAKSMLEQAGTAAFALSVLTDDTLNLIGIGKETRLKAREALGIPADCKLEIVTA